ncbi:lyase [Rhizorhabdus phycosphaerae]|uniref:lyase n=1 Tax=Rhizorhabdus phycosphaerae TaxID=2711156 RepID=UPI0013EB25EA|nr:lyase [Rhizorhabdus phycosphaerae]
MDEPYLPEADFIVMVANEDIPLTGSVMADHNLKLLIAYTRDEIVSNRDWATMVLAGHGPDTAEVLAALLSAAEDTDACVRGEALQGLSERDRDRALPLVRRELMREECAYATFQAAHFLADASLLEGLRAWAGRGGASWINSTIEDAIRACELAGQANT